MAELTLFYFRPGNSVLHSMDARIKLLAVMGISVASLTAGVSAMILMSFVALALFFQARMSMTAFIYEIRYFIVLIVFVFLARALSIPGDPVFSRSPFTVSVQGLVSGAMMAWRLLLIVLLGLSLTATTRPALVRQSIQWFLKPVPGIPHHKIGTMIGLLIRFIPVILMQAREIADAQRARAVDQRKNPVYRMVRLTMSLLRKAFVSADRLALAMEARNYGFRQTPIPWRIRVRDWVALILAACLCILMFCL